MKYDAKIIITAETAFGDVTDYYYQDEIEFVFALMKKYVAASIKFTVKGV
jgi:hypothetical protein